MNSYENVLNLIFNFVIFNLFIPLNYSKSFINLTTLEKKWIGANLAKNQKTKWRHAKKLTGIYRPSDLRWTVAKPTSSRQTHIRALSAVWIAWTLLLFRGGPGCSLKSLRWSCRPSKLPLTSGPISPFPARPARISSSCHSRTGLTLTRGPDNIVPQSTHPDSLLMGHNVAFKLDRSIDRPCI